MSREDTLKRNAQCPYFLSVRKQTITCSGLIKGTKLRTVFPAQNQNYYYCRWYCGTCLYEKCPVYKAITASETKQ